MSMGVIASCFWVLVATGVAFLPMRYQYPPGLALLLVAPVLLVWIAVDQGAWMAVAAVLAFVSMFRRPLGYLAKRAFGAQGEPAE